MFKHKTIYYVVKDTSIGRMHLHALCNMLRNSNICYAIVEDDGTITISWLARYRNETRSYTH